MMTPIPPLESGIPLPEKRHGRSRIHEYPLQRMKIGESFAVANETGRNAAMRAARSYERLYPGVTFTSRKQQDGGFRIWRRT